MIDNYPMTRMHSAFHALALVVDILMLIALENI